jgi:hypothetical protein
MCLLFGCIAAKHTSHLTAALKEQTTKKTRGLTYSPYLPAAGASESRIPNPESPIPISDFPPFFL